MPALVGIPGSFGGGGAGGGGRSSPRGAGIPGSFGGGGGVGLLSFGSGIAHGLIAS